MLYNMMTNQYFYYGIIAAGILGLCGMMFCDLYYRLIIRDLKRIRKAKGKWMKGCITELDNRRTLHQEMENADAFLHSRLAEGKFMGIGIGSWHSFVNIMTFVSACLTGLAVYVACKYQMDLTTRLTYLAGGAGVSAVLLILPVLFGISRKTDRILDTLTDYIENRYRRQAPVEAKAAEPEKDREPVLEQIVSGIRQSAAAGTKFSGLLSKDEEKILREVIQEYMV